MRYIKHFKVGAYDLGLVAYAEESRKAHKFLFLPSMFSKATSGMLKTVPLNFRAGALTKDEFFHCSVESTPITEYTLS